MAGHFLVEAPVMMEEEEVIINDDVLLQFDGGNDITTVDLNEAIEPWLNDFVDDIDDFEDDSVTVVVDLELFWAFMSCINSRMIEKH